MLSILQKATVRDVTTEPFPHIVIPDALPERLYEQLSESYPAMGVIAKTDGPLKNNQAHYLGAVDSSRDARVPSVWQDFVAYHRSRPFLEELADLFDAQIKRHYPWIRDEVGRDVRDFTIGERHKGRGDNPENRTADVVMDCQIGINSPVTTSSSVIAPHLDSEFKLFAGLLYMRLPEDQSTGGDLRLLNTNTPGYAYKGSKFDYPQESVQPFRTVPYRPNIFVAWLNTPLSLHDVSPRSPTPTPRRAVNFLGESYALKRGGYFAPPQQEKQQVGVLRGLARRLRLAS